MIVRCVTPNRVKPGETEAAGAPVDVDLDLP